MFKKALSIMLAVMLVFSAFSMATLAVGAEEINAAADAKTEVEPVGADDTLTVKATSNLFPEKTYTFTQEELAANDNKVTVTYFINSAKDLLNCQWVVRYDGDKLAANEADNVTTNDDDETISTVMPRATDAVINFDPSDLTNAIRGNCTKLGLYKLSKKGEQVGFVSVTFQAKGTGEATVDLDVEEMRVSTLQPGKTQTQDEDEEQLVDGHELNSDVTFDYSTVTSVYGGNYDASYTNPAEEPTPATEVTTEAVEPTTEAAEPTTEAAEPTTEAVEPTTEAVEPTTEVTDTEPAAPATDPVSEGDLTVNVTSNLFGKHTKTYNASTKQVTVVYELNCPGYAIVNSDVEFTYDPEVLKYADSNTDDGICPVAGSQFVCTTPKTPLFGQEGLVTGNFSNIMNQIKAYGANGEPTTFFTVVFDVLKGNAGDTECNLYFKNFRIVPEDKLPETDSEYVIRKGVVEPGVDLTKLNLNDYSFADEAVEPTTVPATEPTTEPPVEDKVYSIAGNNADIFGAEWDASNTATDMTKGDDGLYTITFPDVQPSDKVVEFKVVTNHSWDESYGDETGANVQFIVKKPCNVTVTFDEETKKINVFADVDDGIEYPINPTVEVVRAVGNGQDNWLNDVNWDPDDDINKMQQVAPGVYQIVFDDIDEDLNYQIKFAVNGGWSFNFGAPEDGFVAPNGEAFDASFNGKNIYVHVDNDGSKVIAVLDLSNFDYSTKLGAKATITVVAPAEEPTTAPEEPTTAPVEPTTAPEEPTTAPEEPTTAPEEPTTAPEEPTTAPEEPTTAPEEPSTAPEEPTTAPEEPTTAPEEPTTAPEEPTTDAPVLHVDTTSNYFEAKDLGDKAIGEEFVVSYDFEQPDEFKLVSGQWRFEYDGDKVELVNASMPNITSGMINTEIDPETGKTVTYGNFSDLNGYDFSTAKEFVNAKFKAIAGGEETIKFVVVDLLNEEWAIVKDEVIQEKPEPEPTTVPAEPTTEPVVPTTVPVVIGDNFTLAAQNVTADLKAGDLVKVPVNIVNNPEDGYEYGYVTVDWNKDALELTSIEYNDALAPAQGSAAPINNSGTYKVSFGDQTHLETFKGDGEAFKFVFKITDAAAAVKYDVILSAPEVYDFDINEIEADTINGSVTFVEPTEPTTEAVEPTTAPEEPTTAPEEPTTAPEEPTTAPEEPTTAPEEPTTAPEEPTTAPEEPTTAPEEPTTAPEEPTTAPEEPTTAPEEPTTAPEEPTTAPEETTTDVVETTTDVVETTTDVVEPTSDVVVEPTSSTDATSETKGGKSTSDQATGDSTIDSGSGKIDSGTNGAVQTGNASMAVIILLVLVSATGAIYFARKRVK